MYRVAGEAKAQIGRVVDVASTRDNVPQCDNFIEGEQETHEGSSNISSEEDTRMPVQFVQLNIFRHLSSFEEQQAFLELEDAAKDNKTSDEWQVVVQVDEDCWIPSTSICDLSFVFMKEDVSSGAHDDCRGMHNFFVVTYRYASRDRCISDVPSQSCPSFPGQIEGFADFWCIDQCKVLYNNLRQIRTDMQRIFLCRIAQSQGDFATRTSNLQIPSSSWFYMKYFMSWRGIDSIPGIKNSKPRTVLSWGLAYQSVRHTELLDVLRFDTHTKLAVFRELFGSTTGFGVRKKRPRFSDSRLALCVNDVINAVVCPTNSSNEQTLLTGYRNDVSSWRSFRNGIQKDGIDLAYDEDDGILHVVVRYHKVVVNNGVDETVLACLKSVGVGIGIGAGANEAWSACNVTDSIFPGMEFMDNNFVMRVVSVTASTVSARKKYRIRDDLRTVPVEPIHANVVVYHDTGFVLNKIQEMLE